MYHRRIDNVQYGRAGLKQDPTSPKTEQDHYQGVYILSASAADAHADNATFEPLTPSRTFSSRRQACYNLQ